jgi:cytochrome c oxidase subunit III
VLLVKAIEQLSNLFFFEEFNNLTIFQRSFRFFYIFELKQMSPKTKSNKRKLMDFSRIEKFHPYKTFLFFALLGSTVVFMSITFLYLLSLSKTLPLANFKLPKPFFLSTLLLLFSSFSISKSVNAYKQDSFNTLLSSLGITLVLGLAFAVSQILGWKKLVDSGFFLQTHARVSYLYLISGIHFLHIFIGLIFLSVITISAYFKSKDAVKSLLYFTNDYEQTKLELAIIFWHFVDFLWLGLFLIFLFTF